MAKRQKTKAFSFQGFDAAHYKTTTAYTRAVNALFDKATSDIAEVAHREDYDPDKPFDFDDYPKAKAQLQKTLKGLASKMQAVIETGSRRQWLFACHKNDEFIASIIDTTKLTKGRLQKMQDRNLDALQSFQARKVGGLSLADRVWKYTEQYKAQIELGLDVGLGEGRSAAQLSRDLRQNLQDPNRLFRRVRDKRGNLQLSKAAKAFHPGQGVYRSSYKNAMRLTRSEINMAYREADHLRWQQLDFVVGFEVHRSNHEPKCKCVLCERLVGKYPKWFKFKGWHPQCLCYATAILMDEDDFDKQELSDLKSALKGTEYRKLSAKNEVTELPDGFKDWVAENETKQANWASTPYFIKDNFVDGILSKGVKFTPSDFKPAQDTIAPAKVEVPKQDNSFDYSKRNEALDAYISGDAMWLNNYLRGRGDFGELDKWEQKMLDELTAVTKLDKVGERTLWRSVDARAIFGDMTDGDFEDLAGRILYGDNNKFVMEKTQRFMEVVGKEITERGFMSTTKDKDVAAAWGDYSGSRTPVLMKIRTTANTRGVDVEKYTLAHNAEVEQSQAQKEILLRRGQRYKVVGIKELDGQICVEVELIDDAPGAQTKQDPFTLALEPMQANIAKVRALAAEWGVQATSIDVAIQVRNIEAVKSAIASLNGEVSMLMGEYTAYIGEADKVISEAVAAGIDVSAVRADVTALANKAKWRMNKTAYNYRLNQLKEKVEQSKSKGAFGALVKSLSDAGVEYKEVKKLDKKLSEDEIISRVGGGDLTKGSCSSLALTYAGNKAGLDVLDFRDGKSREHFSSRGTIGKVVDAAGGTTITHTNDFKAADELLDSMEIGKEYYFACAGHAAIVRKTAKGREYLELQSAKSNGFKELDKNELKWRFGARQSRSSRGRKIQSTSYLVGVEQLKSSNGFTELLGYINTNEDEQKKGEKGTRK